MTQGALSNLRVLDLTRVLAGPYCTMMFADMGAEVIKIEIPDKGDDTRQFGPYKNGGSMYYSNVNRNKKGVTLNLKAPEGKELFLKMVKDADVVVENYRPGVMDRLGLGYDVLKEINPRIIYGAVSGFGCYGPYTKRPGYDIIAQAMGGLMSITGPKGGKPNRSGNAMGDVLGGLNLAVGILAAVNARELTGVGQRVDVSLVDSVVASLETTTQRYFASGVIPERIGNQYAATYPYDSFSSKDKDFILGCGNQKLFTAFALNVIKKPELLEDPRFSTFPERTKMENRDALKEIIENWSKDYTSEELVEMTLEAGVPAAPIMDMKDVSEDEHIAKAREMFVDIVDPVVGPMKINGNPIKLLGTPTEIKKPAPTLGQYNEEVYCDIFGMDKDTLKDLIEKKVL